jgi:hypothetical protein
MGLGHFRPWLYLFFQQVAGQRLVGDLDCSRHARFFQPNFSFPSETRFAHSLDSEAEKEQIKHVLDQNSEIRLELANQRPISRQDLELRKLLI